jgi:dimethylargininase
MHVIVREPSEPFQGAISGHPERDRIDPARAAAQHREFVAALSATGLDIVALPPEPALPDAPFVSDTLIALPRASDPDGPAALLVAARPGVVPRRGEVASVVALAQALAPDAAVVEIEELGTLDGGDVIVYGDRVAIGVSGRTNVCGAGQLALAVGALGYRAFLCPVTDRLHLATAITPLGPRRLLGTAAGFASLDASPGSAPEDEVERLVVPDNEAAAANVLAIGGRVFMASGHPRTKGLLGAAGESVVEVGLDEFARADGGPTCLVAIVP